MNLRYIWRHINSDVAIFQTTHSVWFNLTQSEDLMKSTKTNNLKVLVLSTCFACSLNTAVYADNINSLEGIKLGFGYDMGLGITA